MDFAVSVPQRPWVGLTVTIIWVRTLSLGLSLGCCSPVCFGDRYDCFGMTFVCESLESFVGHGMLQSSSFRRMLQISPDFDVLASLRMLQSSLVWFVSEAFYLEVNFMSERERV